MKILQNRQHLQMISVFLIIHSDDVLCRQTLWYISHTVRAFLWYVVDYDWYQWILPISLRDTSLALAVLGPVKQTEAYV